MIAERQQGTNYRIVVRGHLEQGRSEWFNGMVIRNLPSGEAALSGFIVDQAALHGILVKIRDLGLPLISLNRQESSNAKGWGRFGSIDYQQGGNEMQFMAVFTFDPANRGEVLKRRAEKGILSGGKVVGEWSSIAGGKVFRVIETDDPSVILEGSRAWNDLGQVELIPVMSIEELVKLAATKK